MFKVGWLLTHNYETTTILYYTIFLPGVLLHEIIYWLMAGIMNVRADRAIQWPEKQEIGNLQLNFIKLSPKANPLKKAIIAATPLIIGLLAIWVIAVNIFNLEAVMAVAGSGRLADMATAIKTLTSTTDFWLWFYISFTIANTMFPTISKDMKGWWQIGGSLAVIVITLLILGIGQNLLSDLTLSLGQFLNSLSLTLMLTITINITMVILLGAIESTIERVTGHSATFQKGKMITMTREEVLKLKQEKQEKRLATRSAPRRKTALSNPASIYALDFPIPGPPGQEPITTGVAAVLGMDTAGDLPDVTEEEGVVETTATDSTRQRMLKLFSDGNSETSKSEDETKSIADNMPALPSSASSRVSPPSTEDVEDVKPKPEFDVQAFSKPKADTENKPKSPHIDDKDSNKRTRAKLDRNSVSAGNVERDKIKKDANKTKDVKPSSQAPHIPKQQSKINVPPTTPKPLDGIEDTDEQVSTRLPRRTSIFNDMDKPTPSKIEDIDDKDTAKKLPATPKAPNKFDDIEDDEDEQLSTRLPRRSGIFDDKTKSIPSTIDNDDAIEKPTPQTTQFSRPFVKRDGLNIDTDEDKKDDELLTSETSQFQRPFAPPEKSKPSPSDEKDNVSSPSWRSQFSSTPKATNDVDEDEDEDEQLSTRLPRRTSLLDSLNSPSIDSDEEGKKKESAQSTPPSWRSQLSSIPKTTHDNNEEDEDEDEQLPRTGSLLQGLGRPQPQQPRSTIRGSGSRPAPKPTQDTPKQTTSDWRSQLISDEEDDEELNYEPIEDDYYDDGDDDYYDDD